VAQLFGNPTSTPWCNTKGLDQRDGGEREGRIARSKCLSRRANGGPRGDHSIYPAQEKACQKEGTTGRAKEFEGGGAGKKKQRELGHEVLKTTCGGGGGP